MRLLALTLLLLPAACAFAQTPQVAIFADLRPTWFVETKQVNRIRWYDPHGQYSVIGFHIVLETGHIVKVTQRLEKIDNDGERDTIDEAYIESRGIWRLGKQYLPFGQQNIMKESVPALRYDSPLLLGAVPVSFAVSGNVDGYTQAAVARFGGDLGVSIAVGDNLAIQGSSLAQFRRPEDAPGRGRGYHKAIGLDTKYGWAGGVLEAEWVLLTDGQTSLDEDMNLSDLRYRFTTKGTNFVTVLAWSRSWSDRQDWYRAFIEVPVSNNVVWEPFVRFSGLHWQDFGLTARIRL